MKDVLSRIRLAPPLDASGVRRLSRHACLDIHRVQWLRSFLATDGAQMLCWYRAPDAESVRLVLRQQGSLEATVWPAEVGSHIEREPHDDGRVLTLVELTLEGEEPAASKEAALAALADAGHAPCCTFASSDARRLVCLVDDSDETAVTACLHCAGVTPDAVWRCLELDPQPPKLFASQSAVPAVAPGVGGREIEAGVRREARARMNARGPADASTDFDAVIIGAGLSGICTLQRLVRMGLRVRVYESASDVGGVWHWNRYPGARVDSEVYTYGFAFSNELLREWEWQEVFAAQPEIARYLAHVVDRFDLRRHMRFDTRVTAAVYDERRGGWLIDTERGERVAAHFLIAAPGTLSTPQMPDYPGIDEFAGPSCHTARWPASGIELDGKRVGVIGTGASGVQVIQTIAERVGQLTVFQRTPTYCIPQRNHALSDEERQRIRRDWAVILAACRESYGGFVHNFDSRSGLAVTAEEREAKFEELWQQPGFAFWFGNFGDLMMNMEVNAHACDFLRRKITERVDDPEVAAKLLPKHPFGTKRVPLEHGYYEVYNRDNVRLVDLRETPIERITHDGVRTSREEHALDVIVYATGFDAGTGSIARIDIRGEDGVALADKWRQGPKTYLGLLVAGFPNLFIVNGPHNAAALCNAGRCIEQNVDWIARCIEHMRARDMTRIAPLAAAEDEWTEHVHETADASVLGKMTDSWFYGANTPGKPRCVTVYAAGAREYREHCEDVARAGYIGLTMS